MSGLSARRYGERRRDALDQIALDMKRHVAGSQMSPLDDGGRFTRPLEWHKCSSCGAPLSVMPWQWHRHPGEALPTYWCPLCDLRILDRLLRSVDKLVVAIDPGLAR